MSDYSYNYSSNKKSHIYFGNKKNMISFKPFLESFSYSVEAKVEENKTFWNVSILANGYESETRKLAFNVVSIDANEAKENHKKFHKLLRMITPSANSKIYVDNESIITVYFANLIKKNKIQGNTPPTNFDQLNEKGMTFYIGGIEYAPDLEMGFFDSSGLIFAKSFKISMDLRSKTLIPKKQKIKENTSSIPDEYRPGVAFGFPVNIKET